MYEWKKQIQIIVDEIDRCIKGYNDEALTLRFLSRRLGYSEFYTSRKFKEIGTARGIFWILPLIMVFHHMRLLPGLLRKHTV